MLDSALEPSYNLSKNLLLLPWIQKLIVDMVNDSTPPIKPKKEDYVKSQFRHKVCFKKVYFCQKTLNLIFKGKQKK